MKRTIRFFGGRSHGNLTIEDESAESWDIAREFGFDRDIDGTWLVWVLRLDGIPLDDARPHGAPTGSIVVKDARAIAFLDQLADLIAYPDTFAEERVFESDS